MIPGSKTTVGTCGLCGGPVSVPNVWLSVVPPVPTCEQCGATVARNYGPVLPMNPPKRPGWRTGTSISSTDTTGQLRTDIVAECCAR